MIVAATLAALFLLGGASAPVARQAEVQSSDLGELAGWLDTVGVAETAPSDQREVVPSNGVGAPNGLGLDAVAAPTDALRIRLFEAEFEWRQRAMQHRQATFEWQLVASRIVFWVVLAIVGTGLYFSWVQFGAPGARRRSPPATQEGGAAPVEDDVHEFTVKLGALELSATSPVLGVIVLTISIVFFYLYLAAVYPIREIAG